MGRTIQIRDVDDQTYTTLRTRAAAEHLSLSAYLRRQLEQWTGKPTMAEILEHADHRRKLGVHLDGANVVAAIRSMRDKDDE